MILVSSSDVYKIGIGVKIVRIAASKNGTSASYQLTGVETMQVVLKLFFDYCLIFGWKTIFLFTKTKGI